MLHGALRIALPKTRDTLGDRRVAPAPAPQQPDSYLAQLAKLFPTEIVAIYTLGVATLQGIQYSTWWFALLCALVAVILRSIATQSADGGSAQPVAVIVSLVSFLLWVVLSKGWFLPFPEPSGAQVVASVLAPLWLAVTPVIVTRFEKPPVG